MLARVTLAVLAALPFARLALMVTSTIFKGLPEINALCVEEEMHKNLLKKKVTKREFNQPNNEAINL